MKVILENIQNKTKVKDTAKVIKAYKLTPATKVKSKDGAIVPKEVLYMKLVPSTPLIKKEEDLSILPCVLYGVAVFVILIAIKIVLNKIKVRSK